MKHTIKHLLESEYKRAKAPSYLKDGVHQKIELMKTLKSLAEMYTLAPSKIIKRHIKSSSLRGGDKHAK